MGFYGVDTSGLQMDLDIGKGRFATLAVMESHILKVDSIAALFFEDFTTIFHFLHVYDLFEVVKAAVQFYRQHDNRYQIQERGEKAHNP